MEHSDMIALLDKKFHKFSPDAIICPNDGMNAKLPQSGVVHKEHGALVVHKSGSFLVCGPCGHQQFIGAV